MGFDFNPLVWFVCKLCNQTFHDMDELIEHKLKDHLGDCLKIKAIVFEEKLLYTELQSPDPAKNQTRNTDPEIKNCQNRSLSQSQGSNPSKVKVSDLRPGPASRRRRGNKSFVNPYVALPRLGSSRQRPRKDDDPLTASETLNASSASEAEAGDPCNSSGNELTSDTDVDALTPTVKVEFEDDGDLDHDIDDSLEDDPDLQHQNLEYFEDKNESGPRRKKSKRSNTSTTETEPKIMEPEVYKCDICPNTFKTRNYLKTHKKLVHSEERPFKCSQPNCSWAFKTKNGLQVHEVRHTGIAAFKCRFCDKCLTAKRNLADHERQHTGERPYRCEAVDCFCTFASKTALNMHKKRNHREEFGFQQYVCHICGRVEGIQSELNAHIRMVHGDGKERIQEKLRSSGKKLRFECSNEGCPMTFRLRRQLRDHSNICPNRPGTEVGIEAETGASL